MSLQQPLKITLTLLEGIPEQCDRPVVCSTWTQADIMLAGWDRLNNFENGQRTPGYSKTNIRIEGLPCVDSYTMRYDLGSEDGDQEGAPDLLARTIDGMLGMARFYLKPGHPSMAPDLRTELLCRGILASVGAR